MESVDELKSRLQQREGALQALNQVRDFYRQNPSSRQMLNLDEAVQDMKMEIDELRQKLARVR